MIGRSIRQIIPPESAAEKDMIVLRLRVDLSIGTLFTGRLNETPCRDVSRFRQSHQSNIPAPPAVGEFG